MDAYGCLPRRRYVAHPRRALKERHFRASIASAASRSAVPGGVKAITRAVHGIVVVVRGSAVLACDCWLDVLASDGTDEQGSHGETFLATLPPQRLRGGNTTCGCGGRENIAQAWWFGQAYKMFRYQDLRRSRAVARCNDSAVSWHRWRVAPASAALPHLREKNPGGHGMRACAFWAAKSGASLRCTCCWRTRAVVLQRMFHSCTLRFGGGAYGTSCCTANASISAPPLSNACGRTLENMFCGRWRAARNLRRVWRCLSGNAYLRTLSRCWAALAVWRDAPAALTAGSDRPQIIVGRTALALLVHACYLRQAGEHAANAGLAKSNLVATRRRASTVLARWQITASTRCASSWAGRHTSSCCGWRRR